VSSSHVVFTSSSSVIKPLVTDVLTLRCHLRDGATTAIIGKRHAVSEVSSQGHVKSDVTPGGQAVYDVLSQDVQPSDVSFVHSLIITKDGADIATVTDHMTATALDQTPDINVTGHIPGSGAEKAFLEVTWKYPGPDQSGNYQCTVAGTDQLGHFKNFKQTVEITDNDVSMNDVIQYIQQLKQTNDLQAATIVSIKQTNDIYKTTIDQHSATIASLEQSNDLQTSTIATLKLSNDIHTATIANQSQAIVKLEQQQNTNVMFSAYLDHAATYYTGTVIVFNQVFTNVGNSYNQSTGVFTCPVAGYYVFDVHIVGDYDKYAGVVLRQNGHNGTRLAWAFADDQMGLQSASAYVGVVLHQGDTVEVVTYVPSTLHQNGGQFCTFSGHLVNLL